MTGQSHPAQSPGAGQKRRALHTPPPIYPPVLWTIPRTSWALFRILSIGQWVRMGGHGMVIAGSSERPGADPTPACPMHDNIPLDPHPSASPHVPRPFRPHARDAAIPEAQGSGGLAPAVLPHGGLL